MLSTAKSEADEIVNKSTETLSKVIFAERGYHHAKALATHKKQAKPLSLQQRDFDVVIRDMKRTSKRIAKNGDVVIEQQAATIKTLEGKVASVELSIEFMRHQLENEHKEVISDLIIAQKNKVHDLQFGHVTNLAKEKKKLQMKLISEQLRQNSLYNEFLDCRQYARGGTKSESVSRSLLFKRLMQLKEWQSKFLELECVKDDLVDHQCSIVLMEQQLQWLPRILL